MTPDETPDLRRHWYRILWAPFAALRRVGAALTPAHRREIGIGMAIALMTFGGAICLVVLDEEIHAHGRLFPLALLAGLTPIGLAIAGWRARRWRSYGILSTLMVAAVLATAFVLLALAGLGALKG